LVGAARHAIARKTIVIVVIAVLAVGVGEYVLNANPNPNAPKEVDLRIIEDDPVLQLDHFYPDNATVKVGQNITLAIQNGDDELRHFILAEYNINETMPAGTATRVTFLADHAGTFLFYSPATPPSQVSQGRPGPYLSGNLTVSG
jgi:heme/copper-type cytochrome/quinol oxidase subunit 2